MKTRGAWGLSLLAACAGDAGKPTTDDAPAPVAVAEVCADGTWSGWDSPDGLVFVDPAGSDTTGDGSLVAPYQTLQQALRGTMGEGEIHIALGAGTYQGPVSLLQGPGGVSLTVQGCGPDETAFTHDLGQSAAADIAIAGSTPVTLARLRIEDPDGAGVVVRKGANATVEHVRITGARGTGVAAIGEGTRATFRDVAILDGRGGHTLRGWGVLGTHAQLTLEDVTVQSVTSMGVYQRGGTLDATRLSVQGTAATGQGRRGFGIHAFEAEKVGLTDCQVQEVYGAGVLLVNVPTAALTRVQVDQVQANETGGGDGILLARRFWEGPLSATLTDNTVTRAARMGIALAGVDATLSGNTAGADNGTVVDGRSLFSDGVGVVAGDAVAAFDRDTDWILQAYAHRDPGPFNRIP